MLREDASKILGMRIPEDNWDGIALALDQVGRPTRIEQNKLIFLLCKAVESLENAQEVKGAKKSTR